MSESILHWLGDFVGYLSTKVGGYPNMVAASTTVVVAVILAGKLGAFYSSYVPRGLRRFQESVEALDELIQRHRHELGFFFPDREKLGFDVQFAEWIASEGKNIGGWRKKSALKKLRNKVVATADQALRLTLGEPAKIVRATTFLPQKLDSQTSLDLFRAVTGDDKLVAQANSLALHILDQSRKNWIRKMLQSRQSPTKTATKITKALHQRTDALLTAARDKAKNRWAAGAEPPSNKELAGGLGQSGKGQPPLNRNQRRKQERQRRMESKLASRQANSTTARS
jgi:hypothetical protein